MIKSYKQLTGKYLKANKKRSILTIVGIVLSVALIASIGLFLKGIQDAEVDHMKNNYGSWHVAFKNVDSSLVSKIKSNPKVEASGLVKQEKAIKINKEVSIVPVTGSGKGLELLPYAIKEGSFPNNKSEIAVEKWAVRYIKKNAKIGDTINLNNKNYKLVGILQDYEDDQSSGKSIVLFRNNNIDINNSQLFVEISSKTNLKKAVNEISSLETAKNVARNAYLIDIEGGGGDSATKSMFVVVGIIIAIVVIATIAVIYNSFQISVIERIKQFGLLRAVGMTPRQLRKIVFREASILAVIGIPIGVLLGIIAIEGIGITFKLIGADSVMPLKITIYPNVLIISAVIGVIAVYLSAFIPALFAGKISPLVAISSRTSIVKEKNKRRKTRLAKKFFGFEGELAAKNIKRNKKRYRITIFSIVISVVLFVTFKSFMDMVLNINQGNNESSKMSFMIYNKASDNLSDDVIAAVKKLGTVKNVYRGYNKLDFKEYINNDNKIKQVDDLGSFYKKENLNGEQKALLEDGKLEIYDDSSMASAKKYVSKGKIDTSKIDSENGVIVINKSTIYDKNTKKNYTGPIVNIQPGDEIELKNSKDASIKKVVVEAVLKDDPFDSDFCPHGIKLITTKKVAQKLSGNAEIKPWALSIEIKDRKLEDEAQTQIEDAVQGSHGVTVNNIIDQNRQGNTAVLMVKILVYGFVIVVSLIGSVNIVNTLTTNIILRKREFAALKAIGLTQKALKKMIVLEGLLYGIIGTIYGSIIASGLSYLLYKSMSGLRETQWNVPWTAIGIAAIAALLIGYLSVLSPLSRIKKENIIETIREDG